jgi:hypothetical protein
MPEERSPRLSATTFSLTKFTRERCTGRLLSRRSGRYSLAATKIWKRENPDSSVT